MIGRCNSGGSTGGGTTLFAFIIANFESGSTVTCTKQGTGETAIGKGGTTQMIFNVPSTGTWEVKAEKGTEIDIKYVVISTEGQIEQVTLSYSLYLIKDGVIVTSLANWSAIAKQYHAGQVFAPEVTAQTGYLEVLRIGTSSSYRAGCYVSDDIKSAIVGNNYTKMNARIQRFASGSAQNFVGFFTTSRNATAGDANDTTYLLDYDTVNGKEINNTEDANIVTVQFDLTNSVAANNVYAMFGFKSSSATTRVNIYDIYLSKS